jgi:hypothetical protein
MKVEKPKILKNLLSEEDFFNLKQELSEGLETLQARSDFGGRLLLDEVQLPILTKYANKILPKARAVFNSETLLPSYTLFSHYEREDSFLMVHKDDNACTYTLDLCVYYKTPWPLVIEGTSYSLKENEALCFYGEDQLHWRPDFPDKHNNNHGAIFFHFVEPDHWYFTEGPDYIMVKRGLMSEEEWKARNE